MTTLINCNQGKSSSIAVKVQRILCVVYDEVSLKILEITGTHNEASQKATELYGQKNIIANFGEVRFDDDCLKIKDVIGMKLTQFEWFSNY